MIQSLNRAVLVGSLRRDALTLTFTKALMALAPGSMKMDVVPGCELPLYNPDLEEAALAAWSAFRARLRAADGVLFATQEYNRSVPGLRKNALDVGSRPRGASVWSGKPAAIADDSTRQFCAKSLVAFGAWVRLNAKARFRFDPKRFRGTS